MLSKRIYTVYLALVMLLVVAAWATSCSTTSHLPEGEALYVGVGEIRSEGWADSVTDDVREAVSAMLEVPPNSALFGSAYRRSPLPLGLWFYNGLYPSSDHGFRHWLWHRLKSDPILLSQVNPALRCAAAEVTLRDQGFFGARVYADTLFNVRRNKARVSYTVCYTRPRFISDVRYLSGRSTRIDSIVSHTRPQARVQPGGRFSITNLQAERDRLVATMRDSGYFYYAPEHIRFSADTLQNPGHVALRILCTMAGGSDAASAMAFSPCRIDSLRLSLDYGAGLKSQKHDTLGAMVIDYNHRLEVKPKHLRRCFAMRPGALYSPEILSRTQARLSRLGVFKYTQFSLRPCVGTDTLSVAVSSALPDAGPTSPGAMPASVADTLPLVLSAVATYALPWSAKLTADFIYKDNDQIGPSLSLTTLRRNLFHGGETLTGTLTAGYDWNIGSQKVDRKEGISNSYIFGYTLSLSVPRLVLPRRMIHADPRNPVTTRVSLSTDVQSRAGYFSMLKASAELTYSFFTSELSSHSVTPIHLTYSHLMQTTPAFTQVLNDVPALRQTYEDQLIPKVQYAYTYDDTQSSAHRSTQYYLGFTLSEAGGVCDVLEGAFGHRRHGERRIFGQPYSQFIRSTLDARCYRHLGGHLRLATRLLAGFAYAYGNATSVPYNESFYVGGPNSLRGFSVRGVGPATNTTFAASSYGYLMRIGDYKVEANAEVRFPLLGSLHGALFADAGNVWRFRGDDRMAGPIWDELALDAGLGVRYDLGMLVVRLDLGLPLHDPNRAHPSSGTYFNCRHGMLSQVEYNLAIGYPF